MNQILVCSHGMGKQGNTGALAQYHPRDLASFTSPIMVFPSGSETPVELIHTAHFIIVKGSVLTAVFWVFLLVMGCLICRRVAYLVRAGKVLRLPTISPFYLKFPH